MKENIQDLLRRGGGVIRRRDHPHLARRIDRLRCKGELVPLLPGILTRPELVADWTTRLVAAHRWLGPDAVASGHTAARLTFWPECQIDTISFIAPNDFRPQRGWQVMQATVPPELIWHRDDLLVTCPAYTAVDLAAGRDGGDIIDRALRSRQATLDQMRAALEAMPGRVGNRQRRRLLHDSRDKPWSELEREGHRLLRRHRFVGWTTNPWVQTRRDAGYYVDILFQRERVVVEFDGFEFHSSPEAFERDRQRRNDLVLAGYIVLNFTWGQVFGDPDAVIEAIRRAVRMSHARRRSAG